MGRTWCIMTKLSSAEVIRTAPLFYTSKKVRFSTLQEVSSVLVIRRYRVNTVTDPTTLTHVPRRNKDGIRSQVPCPEAVKLYNMYMGEVDVFDSRRKTYFSSRKSRKWWMMIYYFLLDTAITNAYILYKETPGTKELTYQSLSYPSLSISLLATTPGSTHPLVSHCHLAVSGSTFSIKIDQGAPVPRLPRENEDKIWLQGLLL